VLVHYTVIVIYVLQWQSWCLCSLNVFWNTAPDCDPIKNLTMILCLVFVLRGCREFSYDMATDDTIASSLQLNGKRSRTVNLYHRPHPPPPMLHNTVEHSVPRCQALCVMKSGDIFVFGFRHRESNPARLTISMSTKRLGQTVIWSDDSLA